MSQTKLNRIVLCTHFLTRKTSIKLTLNTNQILNISFENSICITNKTIASKPYVFLMCYAYRYSVSFSNGSENTTVFWSVFLLKWKFIVFFRFTLWIATNSQHFVSHINWIQFFSIFIFFWYFFVDWNRKLCFVSIVTKSYDLLHFVVYFLATLTERPLLLIQFSIKSEDIPTKNGFIIYILIDSYNESFPELSINIDINYSWIQSFIISLLDINQVNAIIGIC